MGGLGLDTLYGDAGDDVIVSDQTLIDEDVEQMLMAMMILEDERRLWHFPPSSTARPSRRWTKTLSTAAWTRRFFASLNDQFKDRNKTTEIPDFMEP